MEGIAVFRKRWLALLACFLCASCQNSTNQSSTTSSFTSTGPIYQNQWPTDVQNIIEQGCNGFSIPFFEATYYEASLEDTGSGTFAVIYCYGFDETNAVETYTATLESNGYEIEDLTADYGCYYAQKHLSTVSTSIIQYNFMRDPIDNYFMIATAVSGTTQSANQSQNWPKEEIIATLDTNIPSFENADYYIYSPYVTGDGSLGFIINCYGTNINEQSQEEYKEILKNNGFVISDSGYTSFGVKDNLHIMFYFVQYDAEEAYLVIYAYYKDIPSSTWPKEVIQNETGLDLPAYEQENIFIEYQNVTQGDLTYFCIWIWGANDQSLETYHQQLLNEGWLIDETGSIDNGYVYKDKSGQHRIQSIYYPKEVTYETQDCLFLMIR